MKLKIKPISQSHKLDFSSIFEIQEYWLSPIQYNQYKKDKMGALLMQQMVCEKKTFFVNFYQEYYGWASTCLRCGDKWDSENDGFRNERPFMRGWRKKSIEAAKARYRRGLSC